MGKIVETPEEIKERILDASYERFSRYGFNKTTVTEIAGDCSMSAANLYRYFENKHDIGAGIAVRFSGCEEKVMREEIRKPGTDVAKRLENLVIETLRYIYNEFTNRPHILELVDFIIKERYDLAKRHKETQISLIAEVLAQGNSSGEFDVSDVIATADAVKMAVGNFINPSFIAITMNCCAKDDYFSKENMEIMARDVVRLLINGLKKR